MIATLPHFPVVGVGGPGKGSQQSLSSGSKLICGVLAQGARYWVAAVRLVEDAFDAGRKQSPVPQRQA